MSSHNRTLYDYNEEIKDKLLAPIIYLYLILSFGFLGNLAIVVIYRNYNKSVYRKIIWTIGVLDLVFCLIGAPFNLARLYNYYTFKAVLACEIVASSLDTGIMTSVHLLLLLTIYRFRQVCFPLRRQITMANLSYFIGGCFAIGICLGLPQLLVLQPLAKTDLGNNITGLSCSVAWKDSPKAWKNYNIFLSCLFLTYSVLILLLYALIGRAVYLQAKRRNQDLHVTDSASNNLSHKMTKIAFTVSAVFALSYLPLYLSEVVSIKADKNGSTAKFAFMTILQRSYLINHVANAFIYYIFDEKFRSHLKRLAVRIIRCNRVQLSGEGQTSTEQNIQSPTSVTSI